MNNKSFCIANWKMYLTNIEAINFIKKFTSYDLSNDNCEIVFCPPFTSMPLLLDLINNKNISLGSQDVSKFEKGAYTGESSINMVEELGCKWTIIGHSERRQIFNESYSDISNKMKLVYNNSSLKPIFCIGETLDEMNSGKTKEIIHNQLNSGMYELDFNNNKDLIIAYEPIWAIGTGVSADVDIIDKNIKIIKDFIKKFNTKNCNIYLLYGGSVTEDNASEIYSLDEVNGFLVGSASTNPENFYSIYKHF